LKDGTLLQIPEHWKADISKGLDSLHIAYPSIHPSTHNPTSQHIIILNILYDVEKL
jgi:hypothetical protein